MGCDPDDDREVEDPVLILGERVDGEPEDELEHFYLCERCGQPVDMRDLAAVVHHQAPGHAPLPAADAERLLRIGEQLRTALAARDG